jgi:large subunit ribosomal protein L24
MMNTERVKSKIRKNDIVQVIAGREKGKTGKVLLINTKTGRITVEKVNMVKRHTKPTQQNSQGGIIERELPLAYSNVLLMCAKCNRGVRHGHKMVGDKKVRVCKKCSTSLEATA